MKKFVFNSLNGMGMGLLATLVVGTIMVQVGTLVNIPILAQFGSIAKVLMGAAIGAGVALSVEAPSLVVFASLVTGVIGGGAVQNIDGQMILAVGDPVGAYMSAVLTTLVGKNIIGKTKVDIILVPLFCLIVGGLSGLFISPVASNFTSSIGQIINYATDWQPVLMGITISTIMSLVILSPISSAALAASLGLSGLAAGAAVTGCACSMVGFAISSYQDNKIEGLLSQGIGTSKIQFANAIKNPLIIIPPTLASIVLGGLSTTVFKMECNSIGAGMGTSGLVGQIQTIAVMGSQSIPKIIVLHFLFPAIISYFIASYLKKIKWIKQGDMLLNQKTH